MILELQRYKKNPTGLSKQITYDTFKHFLRKEDAVAAKKLF